jgi:hypothetical protein
LTRWEIYATILYHPKFIIGTSLMIPLEENSKVSPFLGESFESFTRIDELLESFNVLKRGI